MQTATGLVGKGLAVVEKDAGGELVGKLKELKETAVFCLHALFLASKLVLQVWNCPDDVGRGFNVTEVSISK